MLYTADQKYSVLIHLQNESHSPAALLVLFTSLRVLHDAPLFSRSCTFLVSSFHPAAVTQGQTSRVLQPIWSSPSVSSAIFVSGACAPFKNIYIIYIYIIYIFVYIFIYIYFIERQRYREKERHRDVFHLLLHSAISQNSQS